MQINLKLNAIVQDLEGGNKEVIFLLLWFVSEKRDFGQRFLHQNSGEDTWARGLCVSQTHSEIQLLKEICTFLAYDIESTELILYKVWTKILSFDEHQSDRSLGHSKPGLLHLLPNLLKTNSECSDTMKVCGLHYCQCWSKILHQSVGSLLGDRLCMEIFPWLSISHPLRFCTIITVSTMPIISILSYPSSLD